MQVLFDTSVVLDVLLRHGSRRVEAEGVWQHMDNQRITGWLAASTLTDIFYIVLRSADLVSAHNSIRVCLNTFKICVVDRHALEEAEKLPGTDFEDNLQIACATLANLNAIVTRDKDGFKHSAIPTLTPAELLAQIAAE